MKILVSAYACEPGCGSEPAAGWHWATAAARSHDVWVLTRTTNRDTIEAELSVRPQPSMHFVYLDLPPRARFWKKQNRGVRTYVTIWQVLAGRAARRLHREHRFDLVHHVTFANMWLPALACLAPAPFVLGPVGGGQRVPASLFPLLGPRSGLAEVVLRLGRSASRLNPLVRIGWRRAAIILAQNEESRDSLPRRHRAKTVLRPHAVAPEGLASIAAPRSDEPLAVCAGRLNRFKGCELAIRALTHAPGWRLLMIGQGPDEERLRRLAERLGLARRVEFVPWLGQDELWRTIAACRAFVFPSLKEGAPFVVAEAQTLGVPVIALDLHGPHVFAQLTHASIELVAPGRPEEVALRMGDALRRLEAAPRPTARPDFTQAGIERDLEWIYARALPAAEADGRLERVA